MTDLKPLLIGEANPYGADPKYALYPLPVGASGDRLCQIMGLRRTEYLRRFDRANLCPEAWSAPIARARAADLLRGPPYRPAYVLLGAKVAQACLLEFVPFAVREWPFAKVVILPHPSGRNRLWLNADSVPRAREALRAAGVLADEATEEQKRSRKKFSPDEEEEGEGNECT